MRRMIKPKREYALYQTNFNGVHICKITFPEMFFFVHVLSLHIPKLSFTLQSVVLISEVFEFSQINYKYYSTDVITLIHTT